MRELFRRVDKNHDGHISKAELAIAVRRDPTVHDLFGVHGAVKHGTIGERELLAAFDAIDTNGDNMLSEAEFLEHMEVLHFDAVRNDVQTEGSHTAMYWMISSGTPLILAFG